MLCGSKMDESSFRYAMENAQVVVSPKQIIETFGTTSFRFVHVSELMDRVNQVRVRDGSIEAERPRIVSPHMFHKLALEGFGEDARHFADWLEEHSEHFKLLRYGFRFRKTDIKEEVVHDSLESVLGRIKDDLVDEPKSALLSGMDEGWEVTLLKFTWEMIHRSAGENVGEWKRRGLI